MLYKHSYYDAFLSDNWREFWHILYSLNRHGELAHLGEWAKRKRIPGPLRLYTLRLQEQEVRLQRYRFRFPRLFHFVQVVYAVKQSMFPPPRYFPRGSARHYISQS